MKTSWSVNYITEKCGGPRGASEWVKAKKEELERQEGVPWSCYTAHGKYVFNPTWAKHTPVSMKLGLAGKLLNMTGNTGVTARTFLSLAIQSQASIRDVVRAAKLLCERGQAIPVIDRMGKPVAMYRREA